MKRMKKIAVVCALALVAAACGTGTSEVIVVDYDDERNAALPVDDGKPFLAVGCCAEAIAKDSAGNIWVGGGNLVVGRATGGLAAFGPRPDSFDRVEGIVQSIVPDGVGGAYISGLQISRVGRTNTRNLVRIGPDGAMDPAFAPAWTDTTVVRSVAVQGAGASRRLFAIVEEGAGGARGVARIVVLDPATGAELSRIEPRFAGALIDIRGAVLHAAGRGVVVVGEFTMAADGANVAGALVLDPTGREVATLSLRRGQNGALSGRVIASDAVEGANRSDSVYIAGDFDDARVRAADGSIQWLRPGEVLNLARLNWSAAGVTIGRYATVAGSVVTVDASRKRDTEVLYVGGQSFFLVSINGALSRPPNTNIVKFTRNDTTNAVSLSATTEVDVNGYVSLVRRVVDEDGKDVLVMAGGFSSAGVGVSRRVDVRGFVVATWEQTGWRQLPGAFDHDNEGVLAAEWVGDHLLLGGDFRVVGYRVGSLLKLTPDGAFTTAIRQPLQPNDWVTSIAVKDGYVYVGGAFTEVGRTNPVATSGVIRYTEAGEFDPTFSRPITAPDGVPYILDIAFGPDKMYVGGKFNYGGVRNNFVTFSLPNFTLVPGRSWESVDDTVRDISVSADGANVAIAGDFRSMGEWRSPNVVVIDEAAGRIRDSFRGYDQPNGGDAVSVAFDDATGTVYTGFLWGETSIVNQRLDGSIVNRFVDRGVGKLAASNGRLYFGTSWFNGVVRIVDTTTNAFVAV
ncbi:MAG: hypothetical protein ACKOCC_04785 [Actinomycetota bacterium]